MKQKKNQATIVVKTFRGEHTCSGEPRGRNKLANSAWVAKMLKKDVRVHYKSYTIRDIVLECWRKFIVSISY